MATIQKRKKKNGTYSYRVMIRQSDGFPPTSKTLPNRQEAKDWAILEEAKRRQGSYFPERSHQKHTLSNLIDRYIEIILPNKPKNAKDTTRHLLWWKSHLGKYSVLNITPDLIAQQRQILATGQTPKGTLRSSATVNRYLAALSAALTYAVRECGWIQNNPCLRVTKLKESKGRDRIITKEETTQLIEECKRSKNKHLLPIFLIALTTGMRQGEITSLTWDCIDLKRGLINLKDSKNGRPRTISLVGESLEILKDRFLKRKIHPPYVFPSKNRFGHISIRKAWNEALKRAGIKNLRFHDIRHVFATWAAEEGASNLELATAMGHQTLQMLQRYTHMNATITRRLSTAVHKRIMEAVNGQDETSKTG